MSRPPASPAEKAALGIAVASVVGFGIYGFASGAPSTPGYVLSIAVLIALVVWLRERPIPGLLAIALAVDAAAVLAGGMINVGRDVLFNASIGPRNARLDTHILQYDHLVHAFGSFVGTLLLWTLLAPPAATGSIRRNALILCVLAGIGLGGINEAIEFLATVAHTGAHVGGYVNTGWDLVANAIGAFAAVLVIQTKMRPSPT